MDADDLAFAGIAAQAELIRAGTISSSELVDLYLRRIERLDGRLNSFRDVFVASAPAAAAAADAELAAGTKSATALAAEKPLLGVPVAFKDELDIAGRVAQHGTAAYDTPAAAKPVTAPVQAYERLQQEAEQQVKDSRRREELFDEAVRSNN